MIGDPAVTLTVALLLAAIFASAAVTKLRARDAFAGVVANYRLLPPWLVRPVALALPPIELLAALALLLPATRPAGAAVIVLLLLAFAGAMAVNLWRGRDEIDCGCFVALLRQRISWALVARNLALAVAGLFLLAGDGSSRPVVALDWVTVAAGTASALLLHAAIGRLFGLAPRLKGAG